MSLSSVMKWNIALALPGTLFLLNGAPAVRLADNLKFEFANVTPGSHSLHLVAEGARFGKGGQSWDGPVSVEASSSYAVLITCADDGSISPVIQAAH